MSRFVFIPKKERNIIDIEKLPCLKKCDNKCKQNNKIFI